MMDIVLADEHDHDDEEEDDDEDTEEDEAEAKDAPEEAEEAEDPEYLAKLEAAKIKYRKERDATVIRKQTTVFKDVVRSKGFLWLSNKPEEFFEWQ